MKKRLYIGTYILGISLLMVLVFSAITVKANALSDDDKISVNISMVVPEDFSGELRIRYYDAIGNLPDHIFILSERSNYNINIRILPGQFAYKSTEIDGEPIDESIYSIDMPVITVVNDSRSKKEFKGELAKINEEVPESSVGLIDIINEVISSEKAEPDSKPVEENKYFGTMTEREIFDWYREQMKKIYEEDPLLPKVSNVEWEMNSLLHFCSYNMKRDVKNIDDLMNKIDDRTTGRDKDGDYYKTIAKIRFYVFDEWQKGNQVDFVFEEEVSNEVNEEYSSLVDELMDFGNIDIDSNNTIDNGMVSEIVGAGTSDGLILADDLIDDTSYKEADTTSADEIIDEKEEKQKSNLFISFLKKGGLSFIVVAVVGFIWLIIKKNKNK